MKGNTRKRLTRYMQQKWRLRLIFGLSLLVVVTIFYQTESIVQLARHVYDVSEPLGEEDIAIGVITSGVLFDMRYPNMAQTWARHWNLDAITYVGDNSTVPAAGAPNFVVARSETDNCASDYMSLCCKDEFLYKRWYQNEEYKSRKWFIRIVDDTWVHKENLIALLDTLDANEFHYIGHCVYWVYDGNVPNRFSDSKPHVKKSQHVIHYADGGAGWIISAKALKLINENWDLFRETCRELTWDDVVFGEFIQRLFASQPNYLEKCENQGDRREPAKKIDKLPPNYDLWQSEEFFCHNIHKPVLIHHPQVSMQRTEELMFDKATLDRCKELEKSA